MARTLHPRVSTGLKFNACWRSNSIRVRPRGATSSWNHKNIISLNSKFPWSLSNQGPIELTQVGVRDYFLNLANQGLSFIHRDSCPADGPPGHLSSSTRVGLNASRSGHRQLSSRDGNLAKRDAASKKQAAQRETAIADEHQKLARRSWSIKPRLKPSFRMNSATV